MGRFTGKVAFVTGAARGLVAGATAPFKIPHT